MTISTVGCFFWQIHPCRVCKFQILPLVRYFHIQGEFSPPNFTPFGVISSQTTFQWGVLLWKLHPYQGLRLWLRTLLGCFRPKATSLWGGTICNINPCGTQNQPCWGYFLLSWTLVGWFQGKKHLSGVSCSTDSPHWGWFFKKNHPACFLSIHSFFHSNNIYIYTLYTHKWHCQGSL